MDKLLSSMPVDIMTRIPFFLEINGLIKYLIINQYHFDVTQRCEIIFNYLDFYFCDAEKINSLVFHTITQDNSGLNNDTDKTKCLKRIKYDVSDVKDIKFETYERNDNNKFIDLYYKQNIKDTEIFETNQPDEYCFICHYFNIKSKTSDISFIGTDSIIAGIYTIYPILEAEVKLIINRLHRLYSQLYTSVFILESEELQCYLLQILDFDLDISNIEWNQEYNEKIMIILFQLNLVEKIKNMISILHHYNIIYPKMDKVAFLIVQCGHTNQLVTYICVNYDYSHINDLNGSCISIRDVVWSDKTDDVTRYTIDIVYIVYLFNLHRGRMFDIRILYGFFYSLDTYIILNNVMYYGFGNLPNGINNVLISNDNPVAIRKYIILHDKMLYGTFKSLLIN
jgi:hypothetical protein